ncbi:hypothetical protein P8452_18772 [Trifolium repens]|nr:hypothetical protein P8452_18772 [Trifolium repens]
MFSTSTSSSVHLFSNFNIPFSGNKFFCIELVSLFHPIVVLKVPFAIWPVCENSDAAAFYGGSEFHFEMEIDWTFQVDMCSFPLGEGCTTIDIEFLELQARDTLQNICTGPISNAKYMLVYKVEI